MDEISDTRTTASETGERWNTVCGKLPKREIVYFCQVLAIYIIIIACIVNLTLGSDKDTLWASLISASVGFLLPSPKLPGSNKNEQFLLNPAIQQ